MPDATVHLTQVLNRQGIRPSYHRLKILEYLWHCHCHPTVEDIYTALSPEIPSLSKATIYNTLHTFVEAGLVREITIDLEAQHYDVILEDHGHFKCLSCGQIFNIELDFNQIIAPGLAGFQVKHKDVYFSGLCPDCQSNSPST